MVFDYNKYQSTRVFLSPASVVIRYVRLFNLPPEVEDREIGPVLAKYGRIQRLVREKYAEETGFPIWTSVRGAYMELKDGVDIPATLYIRNVRARVFYEGLVNKCFLCGELDHIKAECPKRKSVNTRITKNSGASYSDTLAGGPAKWSKETVEKNKAEGTMTNLNSLSSKVNTKLTTKNDLAGKKRQLPQSSPSSSDENETAEVAEMETDGTSQKPKMIRMDSRSKNNNSRISKVAMEASGRW